MKKIFIEIIGWYGAGAIVLAYFMVSFKMVDAKSAIYQILNFSGAIGIVIVSLFKKAYQPAFLNIIWTIIACIALLKIIF